MSMLMNLLRALCVVAPETLEKPQSVAVKINPIDLKGLMATKFPSFVELLAPWLLLPSLAMIYAVRGVGKTYFALEVAIAVATGGSFLKWRSPTAKGVLLLDGEMPGILLQERLRMIVEAEGLSVGDVPLKLITPDLHADGMLNLSLPSHQRLLENHLDGIALIIVDNLATLCRSGRENEADSWLSVQQWAISQRAKGRSVLFVHHAGKSGEQRGTSAREDILDTVIALRHPDDYHPEDGAVFDIHFEKARSFFGADAASFRATLTEGEDGHREWKVSSGTDDTFTRVVALYHTGLSRTEITEKLGIDKSTVSRHLKAARGKGLIE